MTQVVVTSAPTDEELIQRILSLASKRVLVPRRTIMEILRGVSKRRARRILAMLEEERILTPVGTQYYVLSSKG